MARIWCLRCNVHHECETDHGPDGHGGSSVCCPVRAAELARMSTDTSADIESPAVDRARPRLRFIRLQMAWAALRGRAIIGPVVFRWVDDRGWQYVGPRHPSKRTTIFDCHWDGPIWMHPWTTNPLAEADMLAMPGADLYIAEESE